MWLPVTEDEWTLLRLDPEKSLAVDLIYEDLELRMLFEAALGQWWTAEEFIEAVRKTLTFSRRFPRPF